MKQKAIKVCIVGAESEIIIEKVGVRPETVVSLLEVLDDTKMLEVSIVDIDSPQ